MKEITLPAFTPRPYQLDFLHAMDNGCKRAVLVWHRRAGKEITCWNYMIRQALTDRKGSYCYFFPTTTLGRRILWDGANKDGKRFLDYIPKELIVSTNKQTMSIELVNGSIIQIIGTESVINVGINPIGCVFSEFSLQSPDAWNFTRPILRENGGWAVFNFTPRGRNSAYELFTMAMREPDWFCQRLTIAHTTREDGRRVITDENIAKELSEGMSEHLIQQEYYCSFDLGVEGSFYAKLLAKAELEGRITNVPHEPHSLVDTFWDIGVGDSTAILFVQRCGREIHIIDCYEAQGEGLQHYISIIKSKADANGWNYGEHYAPHDIEVREFSSGARTRLQLAREMGLKFNIVPNIPIIDGIELGRGLFPRLWIDQKNCKHFLKAIENYQKSYNEKYNVYSDRPLHDWSSHVADAFRYMAVQYSREHASGRMTPEDAAAMEARYRIR